MKTLTLEEMKELGFEFVPGVYDQFVHETNPQLRFLCTHVQESSRNNYDLAAVLRWAFVCGQEAARKQMRRALGVYG